MSQGASEGWKRKGILLSFIANSYAAKVSVIVNKIILFLIVAVTTARRGGNSRNEVGCG